MSTGSRNTGNSINAVVRTSRGNLDAARTWVAEDRRAEAKEMFAQHTKETGSLDVLSRCKKLNELLSSDVLKGKGDPKEQLKEILGILHTGPKRPAFLDKPPVTATAGKRQPAADGVQPPASSRSSNGALEPKARADRPQQTAAAADDVDDVINLLNGGPAPHAKPASHHQQEAAERARQEKEAQQDAERKRKALEAAQQEAERKQRALAAQQEAERKRKAQEEAERQRAAAAAAAAAEAARVQRLHQKAAICIQASWRGHCARQEAARRRKQLAVAKAACVLQAAWRARQVVRDYRLRLAAACRLQTAVRAWAARCCLHRLRVEAFMWNRAARVIQRAYCAYRARYTLGPLRVPGGARPPSAIDGSALLAKQLRLRSAMDTRLAPECNPGGSGQDDDGARSHRTVVTHKERVRQMSASERNRRCDVSERAIMVASEHRDSTEALAIARQGLGTPASRTSSPALGVPPSRSGRPGSGEAAGAASAPGLDGAAGGILRPPSSKRRA